MHQYLRAIGFSDLKTKAQLKDLLNDLVVNASGKDFVETDRDSLYVEYSKEYSSLTGITLRGEFDKKHNLIMDYYYPYVRPLQISTEEPVTVERHISNESFAGICEDLRVGVTLIFYVNNSLDMMKKVADSSMGNQHTTLSLTALSTNAVVMLPIQKDAKEREKTKKAASDRSKKIVAAKQGDETAIEKLTIEDMETYSAISKRILTDDIYTLVDSYFMPYGVEAEQYSILGEIEEVYSEKNYLTEEEMFVMLVNVNGLCVTVCVNKKDILGEPLVGRRFKGDIWLSGVINS